MLPKMPEMPVRSAAPGVIPDTITGPVTNGSPPLTDTERAPGSPNGSETRTGRFRRKALRGRLHGYAIATVALVGFLIALAASNTEHVKASWVFGSSQVSLVWLVLFAAILGWLLGLLASARFHWLTRAPRRGGATS